MPWGCEHILWSVRLVLACKQALSSPPLLGAPGELAYRVVFPPPPGAPGELAHRIVFKPPLGAPGELAHWVVFPPPPGAPGELAHWVVFPSPPGAPGELAHRIVFPPPLGAPGELAHRVVFQPLPGAPGELAHRVVWRLCSITFFSMVQSGSSTNCFTTLTAYFYLTVQFRLARFNIVVIGVTAIHLHSFLAFLRYKELLLAV